MSPGDICLYISAFFYQCGPFNLRFEMQKKKSKTSKNKKRKLSRQTSKNVGSSKQMQTKYQHLNMKVKDKLKHFGMDSEKINFHPNPSEPKMSEVILKLAEPYIKMYWGNEIRVRSIISLSTMIWNMSFLSQEEQTKIEEKIIDEVLPKDGDAQDVAQMLRVFEELQERKKDLFPNSWNFILGHDLRIDGENIQLDISSAPIGESK